MEKESRLILPELRKRRKRTRSLSNANTHPCALHRIKSNQYGYEKFEVGPRRTMLAIELQKSEIPDSIERNKTGTVVANFASTDTELEYQR